MCLHVFYLDELYQMNTVSVAALIGGGANSTGSSVARRLGKCYCFTI